MISTLFTTLMQWFWFGVGVFMSLIILTALVLYTWDLIIDFGYYVKRKLFKKGEKKDE